jgi:hypothetical protein
MPFLQVPQRITQACCSAVDNDNSIGRFVIDLLATFLSLADRSKALKDPDSGGPPNRACSGHRAAAAAGSLVQAAPLDVH